MRNLINIITESLNLSYYADASPEKLRELARAWEGACTDLKAEDFDWFFDPQFPLAKIDDTPQNWAEWMREEMKMWAEEGQPDRYADMMDRPIHDPIVVSIKENKRATVWDGNHRVGASYIAGRSTIPAIYGVPKIHL